MWHPDVRFFEVRAANGTPIAHVYIDPYSRPAEKRAGAWMDSVMSRSRLLAPAGGGGVRLPVAVAVCNQAGPVGDAPGLMSMREVRAGRQGMPPQGQQGGRCSRRGRCATRAAGRTLPR